MSWQEFVDAQICDKVECKLALIASLADGNIWAKNEAAGNSVTQEELKVICSSLNNPGVFQQSGIKLGGEKYICISAEPNLVRGRKNKNALCIVGLNTAMILAVGGDNAAAGQLNKAVEALGDYLRGSGY